MNNEVFVKVGKQLTLKTYVPIASRTMSLIAEAAEGIDEIDETFSVVDLSLLLNKICQHMSGTFEVHRTPSQYYQIVYKPAVWNTGEFKKEYILGDFVEADDAGQNHLWISEKTVTAFMDRKLHGVPARIYFYLGHLMTRDETFGISHNISFEQILKNCDKFPEAHRVKHPTTLMRGLADLENAGLIKWNAKSGTFVLLHITPYDPTEKV